MSGDGPEHPGGTLPDEPAARSDAAPDYEYPVFELLAPAAKTYVDAMRSFVKERLSRSAPEDWWIRLVLERLDRRQRDSVEQAREEHRPQDPIDLLDAQHFINIVMKNYSLFEGVFGAGRSSERRTRGRLHQAADARDRSLGHPPRGDTPSASAQEDLSVLRALVTPFDRPAERNIDGHLRALNEIVRRAPFESPPQTGPGPQPEPSRGQPTRPTGPTPEAPSSEVEPEAPPPHVEPEAPPPHVEPEAPRAQVEAEAPSPRVEAESPRAQVEAEAPSPQVEPEAPSPQVEAEAPSPQVEPEAPSPQVEPEAPSPQVEPEAASPQVEPEAPSLQVEPEAPSLQIEPEVAPLQSTRTTSRRRPRRPPRTRPPAPAQETTERPSTAPEVSLSVGQAAADSGPPLRGRLAARARGERPWIWRILFGLGVEHLATEIFGSALGVAAFSSGLVASLVAVLGARVVGITLGLWEVLALGVVFIVIAELGTRYIPGASRRLAWSFVAGVCIAAVAQAALIVLLISPSSSAPAPSELPSARAAVLATVTVTGTEQTVAVEGSGTAGGTATIPSTTNGGGSAAVELISIRVPYYPRPSIKLSSNTLVIAEGGTGTYEVSLGPAPRSDDVEITVTVPDGEALLKSVSPPTLLFTTENWRDPQEVTVKVTDDGIDNQSARTATIEHTATEGADALPAGSVTVEVMDDEIPAFRVISSSNEYPAGVIWRGPDCTVKQADRWYDGTAVLDVVGDAGSTCADPKYRRVVDASGTTSWVDIQYLSDGLPSPSTIALALADARCVADSFSIEPRSDDDQRVQLVVRCHISGDDQSPGAIAGELVRDAKLVGNAIRGCHPAILSTPNAVSDYVVGAPDIRNQAFLKSLPDGKGVLLGGTALTVACRTKSFVGTAPATSAILKKGAGLLPASAWEEDATCPKLAQKKTNDRESKVDILNDEDFWAFTTCDATWHWVQVGQDQFTTKEENLGIADGYVLPAPLPRWLWSR